MALEEALQVTVDESTFAGGDRPSRDLEALDRGRSTRGQAPAAVRGVAEPIDFPVVEPHRAPVRALRRASLPTWILPLARMFVQLEVRGLEHLDADRRAR